MFFLVTIYNAERILAHEMEMRLLLFICLYILPVKLWKEFLLECGNGHYKELVNGFSE